MKPNRYFFRGAPLFGMPLCYGTPLFVGFTILITGLTGEAAIYGGAAGARPGTAQPGTATAGATAGASVTAARDNARAILNRTNQAVGAARALQQAARAAALGGTNPLGANPANPASQLPTVPNGLAVGGLHAIGGNTHPTQWTGASAPTHTVAADGATTVTIKQTTQQALLNWQTFNVGKQTTLTFDQSAGGANVSQWIAFNKVTDPTANPTQILGSIKADGQVYVINPNGIIFGGGSVVNARGLTVSSLPINTNLIQQGLLNNPDAQFLFSGLAMPAGTNGTPGFTPEAPLDASGKYGDVIVQAGAVLTSPTNAAKVGGRVTLVGPNVINDGSITTPDGQTILAAGLQVGFDGHASSDPSLRGLDVFVGAVADPLAGSYAGVATQNGIIEAPRGNITIAGRDVRQLGILDSSTSIALNGRIDLQAFYDATTLRDSGVTRLVFHSAGNVTLGADSLLRILPELDSSETTIGTELALRSAVNLSGSNIHVGGNSTILAPNALVAIKAGRWNLGQVAPVFAPTGGQVYFEEDALLDVSGSIAVSVPVTQNIITVQLRGAELADSPLQRTGILRNATVSVDIRDTAIYQQELWRGTPLADLSGFINLIPKKVGQLTVAGGTVNVSSGDSVVMQAGSKINVSGGSIQYEGGIVKTTQLVSNGQLVDISAARPDEVYQGISDGSSVVSNARLGVTTIYRNPLTNAFGRYEESSITGGAGGTLAIAAPAMALDGILRGVTFNGDGQRQNPTSVSTLKLAFVAPDATYPTLPLHAPSPPQIVFQAGVTQPPAAAFVLDSQGDPQPLDESRMATVFLSPGLLTDGGFGSLTVDNPDGRIDVPAAVELRAQAGGAITFKANNITIDGSVRAPGGTLAFSTYNISLDQLNAIRNTTNTLSPAANAGRGIFTLGAGGILDASGLLVDDRPTSPLAGTLPVLANGKGGSIRIDAFSANLAAGGTLNVAGGITVSPLRAVTYGEGGALAIATGNDLNLRAVLGGKLTLGATLLGYSGTKGASLALTTGAFQVGGSPANSQVTAIDPGFFSQGGFNSIGLTGLGLAGASAGTYVPGVTIAAGTHIQPVVTNRIVDLSTVGGLVLTDITRQQGVRSPVNLSFGASGVSDEFSGLIVVRGDVVMAEGSSIVTDAKATVTLQGQTATVLGSIDAAGGTIVVGGAAKSVTNEPNPTSALVTTLLGSAARLSTAGRTVYTESPYGIRQGEVLKGGTITLSGNLVAGRGAVLDVSGTSGVLDLAPGYQTLDQARSNTIDARNFVPVTIASDGGNIVLRGGQFLYSDATLIGRAGGTSAIGGNVTVSSNRFVLPQTAYHSAEANLIVKQGGFILPGPAVTHAVGLAVRDGQDSVLAGIGMFDVDRLASGGFNSLALGGNVRFDGAVSVTLPGSLRVATGGVIYAGQTVKLAAGYIALGQTFKPPVLPGVQALLFTQTDANGLTSTDPYHLRPTYGTGRLEVTADLIDVGDLSLQGIGNLRLVAANGDIRGNGTLSATGELFLKAGQIYPTTGGHFDIFAHDSIVAGSVTIEGGASRPLPYSAGGELGVYAATIRQGGTLRAPIGTIQLGWDGNGAAPVDAIAGSLLAAPITAQLTLGAGSVTSVSAIDPVTGAAALLPYGISLDGSSWIDPAGTDITVSGVPAKAIHLAANNLTTEPGSLVDIKGGGDLFAYRWISGSGGTNDVLAAAGSFAVIPGYAFDYAPYAPFNDGSAATNLGGAPGYVNSSLKVGDQVTLAAGANLPAGTYTLLPARYALLPGAFLVTPQSGTPVGGLSRPDDSVIVSGYLSNNLDAGRAGVTRITRFEVAGSAVVKARSEYQYLSANTVLRAAAVARGFAVPRLPVDAGYLAFSSAGAMSLAGLVASQAPAAGRGSLIDINSEGNILINNSGTGGAAGDLVLQSSLLNSFGAESLLIGGLRAFSKDGVSVSVTTDNLTVNNAGSQLAGSDLILVAAHDLTLAGDSQLVATGKDKTFDDLTLGSSLTAGSGDGALVRVSGNDSGSIQRVGVGASAGASLSVGQGAELTGGGIILDSTNATALSSNARLLGEAITLRSGQLSIQLDHPGLLHPTVGLVLSGDALAGLQTSAKRLTLLSYSSIDVYGTGQVGSRAFEQLSLQAASIRGFNSGGGTAQFSAKNLLLENTAARPAPAAPAGALLGTLAFDADRITLGGNNLRVDGAAETTLNAQNGIWVAGNGGFSAAGNLKLVSPLVTGENAANYQIMAGDLLQLSRPATTAGSRVSGGYGAELALVGGRVTVDSDIVLASGELTLHATSGDLLVGGTAATAIDVGGTATRFVDLTRYSSGGIVHLLSDIGSVNIAQHGDVSVAAQSGGGDAGRIEVAAPGGVFELSGTIHGTAGAGGRTGEFVLDAGSISGGSLAALDATLNAGRFSQTRRYRIRSGDVLVDGSAQARDYQISADHGTITVTGTIDASGTTGGNIQLQATGSLVLANGSSLTVAGRQFSTAGKGGTITLEAGAARNGVIDPAALLEIRSGSALDLAIYANQPGSATLGQFTGKLHLRAPRNAANNDLQIAPIAGSISGASSILVEGYKIYALSGDGPITTTVQNNIRNDASAFLGAAGTTTAGYTTMLARLGSVQPGLNLILAPGAEIINPGGNLTLGTTTSTASADWNLETYRFGPLGAPGVLTLRAAGNLVFYNALSDGFAAVTPNSTNGQSALWLAPLMEQNPLLPVNTQSWSYRLTSGADLGAADFGAVLPESGLQTDKGSLLLGKNYGNARLVSGTNATTAAAIANRYQVIRTGSGDITVNAARNAYLLNQFCTIYTAGTKITDPSRLFAAGDFSLPVLGPIYPTVSGALLGTLQQDYPAQYSMAGGDLTITAGGDIARMTRDTNSATGGRLIADSSRELPTNWLYRRGYVDPATGEFGVGGVNAGATTLSDPSASTTWWVDFSNFFEGVGTLGGGDVTLTAGNDVQNLDAVAATNARMASGKPDSANLIELGGGDVTVSAGRNIDGGVYYVERGAGRLLAGADITTNATRSPSPGLLSSLTNPVTLDPNTWLATTLFLGKGGFDIQARGDVLLGAVANPFLLPAGIGNKFWYKTYFNTYDAASYVNVVSLGGSITQRTEVVLPTEQVAKPALQAWLETQQLYGSSSASYYQPWLRLSESSVAPFGTLLGLMAPTLRLTAQSGDIHLAGDLTLFPASKGQIELVAAGSVGGLGPLGLSTQFASDGSSAQIWSSATVNLSDADPASIPNVVNPYAYQSVVGLGSTQLRATGSGRGTGFLDFIDQKFAETGSTTSVLQTKQALHGQGLLHLGDSEPVRLFALAGDLSGVVLFSSKSAVIHAGNDLSDVAFYLQNIAKGDTSIVSAGRDLILFNANTAARVAANAAGNFPQLNEQPLAGDIQVSGPGSLQVLAGRTLDLGTGSNEPDGTGVGITSTGNLRNSSLPGEGADLLIAAGIGLASSLSGSSLAFDELIALFVTTPDGQAYLQEIAPGVDFAALAEEEQATLALKVFYLTLRDAGRDFNDPKSPDYQQYTNGMAAIKALFGDGRWQGEILTQGRDIRTRSGGDISLLAPGGGLVMANTTIGNPLTPPGIVTEAGGKISIFTDQSVNIGIGRIFSLRGGDATIWSTRGDIAAGSSSRTIAAAPPTRVLIDPQSATVETDLAGLATGGGIGVLATVEGVKPGDVDLIAPAGSIDAGDAGIRVSGNINLAGVTIVNAGNISAGGTSTGAPAASVSAPSISTVTAAANTSAASTATTPNPAAGQAAANERKPVEEALSIITVEVLGYGGSADTEEDEDKKDKEELP